MDSRSSDVPTNQIRLGDFPFPINMGAEESRYLTWLRNHSNYMAVRGPFDYFRAVGVLVRGILVNFLTFVPYLLGIALVVAASRHLQFPAEFILTKSLLVVFVVWTLLLPVLTPFFKILRYQKSRDTGSDSSVKSRDLYERSFGAFVFVILAVSALESLPGLLKTFHQHVYVNNLGWPTLAAGMAAASAIFSVAPKILSLLGAGATRLLVLIILGALGALVPLVFVLFVSDYLVFGPAWDFDWGIWTVAPALFLPIGLAIAGLLGWFLGVLRLKENLIILLLLTGSIGLFTSVIAVDSWFWNLFNKDVESRDEAIVELRKHPEDLETFAAMLVKRPSPSLQVMSEGLQWVRDFESGQRLKFSRQPVDLEDLDELRNSLAGMGHEVGLQPQLGRLLAALPDGPPSAGGEVMMTDLHRLYSAVVTLHDLVRSKSVKEQVINVITLSEQKIDALSAEGTGFLQKTFGLSEAISCEFLQNLDKDLCLLRDALNQWSLDLAAIHDEIGTHPSIRDTSGYLELIERIAEQPGSKLEQLRQKLGSIHQLVNQRRILFSRAPVDFNQFEALRQALDHEGHGTGLQPEIGRLVAAMPAEVPVAERQTLMQNLHRLYSGTITLAKVYKSSTVKEQLTRAVTLSSQEIDALSIQNTEYLQKLFSRSESLNCEPPEAAETVDCAFIKAQEEDLYILLETLHEASLVLHDVQREMALGASILLLDTTFYSTVAATETREQGFWPKFIFLSMLALELWFVCWLTVDVNLTSIHGLYRDRLASAFLVGEDTAGDIDIEEDIDLMELSCHEAGSTAPYHLINVALNLQGSKDIGIRDRKSDFFVFSKKFIGSKRTGYCRSEAMEQVFPQMDVATAMAISAAAASPNMGRSTNPTLVVLMTLVNVRLGFWVPNPGLMQDSLIKGGERHVLDGRETLGFSFERVFKEELIEVKSRWKQLICNSQRCLAVDTENRERLEPTPEHNLVGIAFSGGGIRSATINLGITQALHSQGVFDHVDYMSTVSGGGYLGSSISTLMRRKPTTTAGHEKPHDTHVARVRRETPSSFGELFRWRIRPGALIREAFGKLDETSRWVNVSDGGHIENLATIELLRRRCQYIIIGDGEADPQHYFHGLATLVRTARIDLGIHIDINLDSLRSGENGLCSDHWAIGRVDYPGEQKRGYLLYFKSSLTGDEDAVIQHYRNENPSFPHESTADQFFSEGQFEAYRSLGQHMAEKALGHAVRHSELSDEPSGKPQAPMTFVEIEEWFEMMHQQVQDRISEDFAPTNSPGQEV